MTEPLTHELTGAVSATQTEALAALLDRDPPTGTLPLLWHCVHLLDHPRQDELGIDGHRSIGALIAPPDSTRPWHRMFAGGRVSGPGLQGGEQATRRSRIVSETSRTGRSGELHFVTVEHLIEQSGIVTVREEQDIVYRPLDAPVTAAVAERPRPGVEPVDPTLLFRFSALTYNAHRIHYDRQYAVETGGYPGLLVHGPWQALSMAEQARPMITPGRAASFDYRLVAPLFDFQGMRVTARCDNAKITTAVSDASGRVTATGTVTIAD